MNLKKNSLRRVIHILMLLCIIMPIQWAHAQAYKTHCKENEYNVISFKIIDTSKLVSICEGPSSSYLVYRFGKPNMVELQYPEILDEQSWSKFTFKGWYKREGIKGIGVGIYSLEFSNEGVTYYMQYGFTPVEFSYMFLNITVITTNSAPTLNADSETVVGTLAHLNGNPKIKSSFPDKW